MGTRRHGVYDLLAIEVQLAASLLQVQTLLRNEEVRWTFSLETPKNPQTMSFYCQNLTKVQP